MTLFRSRFAAACAAREAWGEEKGYDGWNKHPAAIAEEMLEEAVDIPVWSKGITRRPVTRRQRSLIWTIGLLAAGAWYLTDFLRRSLEAK